MREKERKYRRNKKGGKDGEKEKRVIGLAREQLSSSLFQTILGGHFSHRRRRGLLSRP